MFESESHVISLEEGLMIFESKTGSAAILSVPHDGLPFSDLSGFFKARKVGYKGRDRNVWPLAKGIVLEASAHAIRGLLPRTLVDYNRAWPIGINYYPLTQTEVHTALDDERLARLYRTYHESIGMLVAKAKEKYGQEKTLLIDLHGFSKQPPYAPKKGFDLILGTGNRTTVPHGEVDRKMAEFLRGRGYEVFLPEAAGPEEDYYSADFTTRHHSEKHGINVIQVEVAARFRLDGFQKPGRKLSSDIALFLKTVL